MKRKIAGLLAALMVLSVGTTVFATENSTNAPAQTEEVTVASGVAGVTKVEAPTGLIEKVDAVAADIAASAEAEVAKTEGASVLAVMDVVPTGKYDGKGITLTFTVSGVKAGDNIQVLHFNGTEWEVIEGATAGEGTVTARFTSLSPVAIVKLPATSDSNKDENKAPATGSTAPVAAVLAMICLAGVAVCGKKVKFNA